MRRMSGTDSLFISGETPTWHQHIAGLVILDLADVPGFGFNDVVRTVSERLPLIPKLTWKLKSVPLGLDRSVWVDDAAFDIRRHMHHITARSPGGPRETAAAVAPILSRQLDRRYPLWELWYVDGIVNGRVAVVMKFHHCVLDGGAGSVLATLLLDTEPSPPPRELLTLPAPEPEPNDLRGAESSSRCRARPTRRRRTAHARHRGDVAGAEDVVQLDDRPDAFHRIQERVAH